MRSIDVESYEGSYMGESLANARQRLLLAAGALVVVVSTGTVGYMLVEGWNVWRSFFFTLITVTTVGYSADGLSETGERFTAILLIFGIASASYAFGVIVQASIVAQLAWRNQMHRRLKNLKDHYIICGFGRIGRRVCQRLESAGIACIVIEGEQDALEEARERGFFAIRGNATEDEVLVEAGIERAKGIVCAVNTDADNIVIALGARELRPDISIIARVDDDGAARKIKRAGADHIISPFRTAAVDIANSILQPNVAALLQKSTQAEGGFELSEITVGETSHLGETVGQLRTGRGVSLVFVAIKRSDGSTILGPDDDEVLLPDDVVIIAGDPINVKLVTAKLNSAGPVSRSRRELTSWGPVSISDL